MCATDGRAFLTFQHIPALNAWTLALLATALGRTGMRAWRRR